MGLKKYSEWYNNHKDNKLEESISSITKKLGNKSLDFVKSVWDGAKRERAETQDALKILKRMIRHEDVSTEEKKFMKAQAKDLAKLFPLIAIQGIPGGTVAITPLLIHLGKKYNFDMLPNSHKK